MGRTEASSDSELHWAVQSVICSPSWHALMAQFGGGIESELFRPRGPHRSQPVPSQGFLNFTSRSESQEISLPV